MSRAEPGTPSSTATDRIYGNLGESVRPVGNHFQAVTTVRDGCLVPTEPLAAVLNEFISHWNQERPQRGGQFASPGEEVVSPVRAYGWLAENSGVAEATISRIVGLRSNGTELRIADALVQAIERPELFYDGEPPTLPIYPNPMASAADRISCCGGSIFTGASLTGVADF